MKKIVRMIYTGLLGASFFVFSPIIAKQALKEPTDAKAEATAVPYVPAETETISQEETTEPIQVDASENSPAFVKSESSYFDDALFIGDSRIEDFRDYGTLNNADYLCSTNLAAYELLSDYEIENSTFSEKISSTEYQKIYLMLGLNEAEDGAENFRDSMTRVLQMIQEQQPNVLIFLMANLHVSVQESNENINALNEVLQELADNQKIFYLDVNPLFDDENGCLPEEVSEDGVHLSPDYYPQWCNWICEHTITEESKKLALSSLTFGEAIENVKNGKRIARKNWEKHIWLELHQENKIFSIQLHSENNQFSPWTASQEDMLAEDWYLIEELS